MQKSLLSDFPLLKALVILSLCVALDVVYEYEVLLWIRVVYCLGVVPSSVVLARICSNPLLSFGQTKFTALRISYTFIAIHA